MEPSYKITTEHSAHDAIERPNVQWLARITRVSDGSRLAAEIGATEAEVVEKARAYIAAIGTEQRGRDYYTDEKGELVNA